MPNQPLVSIIIPTFNRAHLLGETLDSVLAQTYQNWECIVVDDGSTDGTEALLKAYMAKDSRFQYYKRPDSYLSGGNGARNYGFEVSNGGYVQWFDDDDVMLEMYISDRIPCFTNEVNMVICTGYMVDTQLENKTFMPIALRSYLYKDYVTYASKILIESIIFRKTYLLEQDELFRNDLTRAQESELFLRLFYNIQTETYVINDKGMFLYRQHPLNKTTKDQVYYKSFKRSRSIIYSDNLKKCIALRDQNLITLLYRNLLTYFFEGIKHDHRANSRWILKELVRDMRLISWPLSVKLWLLGHTALILNYPVYRFHTALKFDPSLKNIS